MYTCVCLGLGNRLTQNEVKNTNHFICLKQQRESLTLKALSIYVQCTNDQYSLSTYAVYFDIAAHIWRNQWFPY